ncbi:MAG: T9SS type A sorting domain-containing protein [Flavobacteriaceae bacterium]|nr:T9SS type A sorting domain-containing protein [Flavobacteriaceae bacterium]
MRIFLCISVFFSFLTQIYAQNPPQTKIDSMLVAIDQTAFDSGILYDRVVPTARLSIFNDSINVANTKYFKQSLLELYRASNTTKFISSNELWERSNTKYQNNVVDIALINATFHTLNYNPETENEGGLRIVDEQFEKIENGTPAFLENHLFMVSPLKQYAVGEEITYQFKADLIFQETENNNITQLVANFDTNQDYIIIDNGVLVQEEVVVAYSQTQEKIITITATFADGSTKTTQGVVHVKVAATPPPNNAIRYDSINATIPFQGYEESVAYYARLEYRTFFHSNLAVLQKPIVIIDGFDPLDKRQIQDSDPHPDSSDEEHFSIEEMMTYYDSQGDPHYIIEELNGLGYDVVIVNHPVHQIAMNNYIKIDGGADYIERNALGHVALYQQLNNELVQNGSAEQLVIVGPSMGGQISRYALAYMEKNGISHNARLWVSIDSPHLGANIPMGAQALVNLINDHANSSEAEDFVDNQLGSPAARQQLIEQYKWGGNSSVSQQYLSGKTISQGYTINRGHPFFIQYYNNLFNNGLPNSKGYPQNLRKIALINGSLQNKTLFENPYVPGGTEISGTLIPDNYAFSGEQTFKIEGYTNVLGHTTTMETYNMPSVNTTHKIAFFKKKTISWDYYDCFISSYNSRGNMDNTPGGWYPTQWELAHSIERSTPCEWVLFGNICVNDWDINKLKHVSSFIPTVSSLGFYNPEFNWSSDMNRNLVCTEEIPFDTYFGPNKNERHTSFTEESVNWLYQELAGNEQSPIVYLKAQDLEGPQAVCYNSPATFEFANCKAPRPVQYWEVSAGLQIVTSDDYSVTVEGTTSSSMQGYIKAIFPHQVVQKNVWLGRPGKPGGPNGVLSGPTLVNTGATVNYSGGVSEGAASYTWWLPEPYDVVAPFDYLGPNWQVPPNAGRSTNVFTGYAGINGNVQLMGHNTCGDGDAVLLYVEHGAGGAGQNHTPVFPYPNTADEAFNLDFSSYPPGDYHVTIFDMYSNVYYDGVSSNIEKTIITENIPNGTYFLHIYIDNELTTYQLIINH